MTTIDKVFLDYSQADLDRAYDQTLWAPNINEMRELTKTRSAAVRARHPHFEYSYGPSADETIEFLPTAKPGAPIVLFVHGGRWLPMPDNAFIHFAETFTAAGANFAAARFVTLQPQPGPVRLTDMVEQLRRCVVWLYRNANVHGGHPERIHLIGHSSGGHLASVLLTTDWTRLGVPETVLKSGACVSGMYDLRPVLLSARSSYVKLTPSEENDLSAMRHLDRVRCAILVAYGDKESPEFQRHGREFVPALQKAGHQASLYVIPDSNHFEGVATLADAHSPFTRVMLKHMGLL